MAYLLAPDVEEQLHAIWYYVAQQSSSLATADRLVDAITSRFSILATHPWIGRRRDDDFYPGVRSFPVGEYVIFYRIVDDDVVILQVVHGSRDLWRSQL